MTAQPHRKGEGSAQRENRHAGPSVFSINAHALIRATAAAAPMREQLRPLVGDLVDMAIYWRVFDVIHIEVDVLCRDTLAPWWSR
jgi:hypothetical protein